MILKNKLGIDDPSELAREEERIGKTKAAALFASGLPGKLEAGTFASLAAIHEYLFGEVYEFAGKIRAVNIAKGGFRFASALYLEEALRRVELMKLRAVVSLKRQSIVLYISIRARGRTRPEKVCF